MTALLKLKARLVSFFSPPKARGSVPLLDGVAEFPAWSCQTLGALNDFRSDRYGSAEACWVKTKHKDAT